MNTIKSALYLSLPLMVIGVIFNMTIMSSYVDAKMLGNRSPAVYSINK